MRSFCDCYRPVIERPLVLSTAILIHVLGMIGRFLASAFSHPCAWLFRLGLRLGSSCFPSRSGFRDSFLDCLSLIPLLTERLTNGNQRLFRYRMQLGPAPLEAFGQLV